MYKGTLIDDLIATVERAEERARTASDTAELERRYTVAQYQAPRVEPALFGVA